MEKAFDRIDRNLLFFKLLKMGFGGKTYRCLKNIYDGSKACVNVNGFITNYFDTDFGVKQGDCLSPTLFNLFINDLITDIKSECIGVDIGVAIVHCLMYADDLALIAESEKDLQDMLSVVSSWCNK